MRQPLAALARPSFRGRPAAEDQVKPRRVGTLQCAVVGLLGFQVVSMGLHARSHDRRASAAARPPPPPVAPRPPPGSLRLSDAEEALLAALPTEPERVYARQIFEDRVRGPLPGGLDAAEELEEAAPAPGAGVPPPPPRRRAELPAMYGDGPRIVGLDRCAGWRETTSLFRRAATAGIFNSGTNLMTNLLRKNCVMPLACPGEWGQKKKTEAMARRECIGYPFQAPWGKHNPLAYRDLGHVVDSLDHFNLTEILPVAVVKDPITWMRSMCRIAYAAHFRKHPACCPSPLDPAQLGELLGHNRSKVTVKFRKEHPEEVYASLLDLWNVWYREYYDATLPRLIVRYEDLLFDPQNTIREVCACAGGRLKKDFDMVGDAAKFGGGHGGGEGTSRGSALKRYASETTRYHLVSAHDVAYYGANVDGALADLFHYAADEHRRAAADPRADAKRAEAKCATLGKRRLNGA